MVEDIFNSLSIFTCFPYFSAVLIVKGRTVSLLDTESKE